MLVKQELDVLSTFCPLMVSTSVVLFALSSFQRRKASTIVPPSGGTFVTFICLENYSISTRLWLGKLDVLLVVQLLDTRACRDILTGTPASLIGGWDFEGRRARGCVSWRWTASSKQQRHYPCLFGRSVCRTGHNFLRQGDGHMYQRFFEVSGLAVESSRFISTGNEVQGHCISSVSHFSSLT